MMRCMDCKGDPCVCDPGPLPSMIRRGAVSIANAWDGVAIDEEAAIWAAAAVESYATNLHGPVRRQLFEVAHILRGRLRDGSEPEDLR